MIIDDNSEDFIDLVRRPGRTLSLRVMPDGAIRLNAPTGVSRRKLEDFVGSRQSWIKIRRLEFDQLYDFSPSRQLAPGLKIWVEHASELQATEEEPGVIYIRKPPSISNWQAYGLARPLIKGRLNALARPKLANMAATIAKSRDIDFESVNVKFLRSRWGSCTNRGKISLNSQLLRLPERLQEYVVCHELAHLKEPNHSPLFYKELGHMMDHPIRLRRELKEYRLLH